MAERTHIVSYDSVADVLTFDGFKFSGELMRQFTETPCGVMFRVTQRDEAITVSQERHPLAAEAPAMLAQLIRDRDNFQSLSTSDDDAFAAAVRRIDTLIAKADVGDREIASAGTAGA